MSIQVTHAFVSSKPEQSDPTLIGPNEWNAQHVVVDTSVPTSFFASNYIFTPQTPNIPITGGISNTITLSPVPTGVNASDVGHYLYISGGTGTPEAVLITGGTAVAGAASGTLNFVAAYSHTGLWTISTATCGVQEALQDMSSGGCLKLNSSIPCTFHAKVTPPAGLNYCIDGESATGISIRRGSDYPNGDLFYLPSATGFIQFVDLAISDDSGGSQTAGAVIHAVGVSCDINNVFISAGNNSHIGLLLDGTTGVQISNFRYVALQAPTMAAIQLIGTSAANYDINYINGSINLPSTATTGFAFLVQYVNGLKISNSSFNGGPFQVFLQAASGDYVTNVSVSNCYFNYCTNDAIRIDTSLSANTTNVRVMGCQILGGTETADSLGIDIGFDNNNANGVASIQIVGNFIQGWHSSGIGIGSTGSDAGIVIIGNIIYSNNLGAFTTEGGIHLKSVIGVVIVGNYISSNTCGIYIEAGGADFTITSNDFYNNTTQIANAGVPQGIIANNTNISNISGATVASAATLIFPIAPNFIVSGTTSVTSVNMQNVCPGSSGTLRTPNGQIFFQASSTIGNSITTTQNVLVTWYWDGTQVWLK